MPRLKWSYFVVISGFVLSFYGCEVWAFFVLKIVHLEIFFNHPVIFLILRKMTPLLQRMRGIICAEMLFSAIKLVIQKNLLLEGGVPGWQDMP